MGKLGREWTAERLFAEVCRFVQGANSADWGFKKLAVEGIGRNLRIVSGEMSDNITNLVTWRTMPQYCLKKEWYDETKYVPFEHIKILIPGKYDEVLKAEYGDYMTIRRFAAEHDYPFYGHMENELIKQIRAVGFEGTVEEFCSKVSNGELFV